MYTTTIGRTFLKAYNQKKKADYTARSFFEKVFIPLFFNHPKYMMTAGNSPLENPKISWDDMILGKKSFETPERRGERINKMLAKVETEQADASIAIGYPVLDNTAGTSGQISSLDIPGNEEDVYLSWIGAALGIGVSGGITILFDHEQILLEIFEGWKYYREYLEKTPLMKGNQINTWNGNWVAHRYDPQNFEPDDPTYGMNALEKNNKGLLVLQTINWVMVMTGIAQKYPLDNIVGYLYNIGQTNTTIGFIPFKLDEINRPNLIYQHVFGTPDFMKHASKLNDLYGTAFGLRAACSYGSVGVRAMEPKGLKAYLPSAKSVKKINVKENNEDQKITFNTYLIWIIAMMNNEQLWETSQKIAKQLLEYEAGAEKARMNRKTNVKNLFASTSSKHFLQSLIPIIEDSAEKEKFEEIGKTVHKMPRDNFPYFNTLIRFQYALLNN